MLRWRSSWRPISGLKLASAAARSVCAGCGNSIAPSWMQIARIEPAKPSHCFAGGRRKLSQPFNASANGG